MGNLLSALLIFGILGAMAVFFIIAGMHSLRYSRRRDEEQTGQTTGVVVDERMRTSDEDIYSYWYPVIRYTAEGREYESEYPVGFRLVEKLEVGRSVDVFYDPSNPEKYHIMGEDADYRAGKHCVIGGLLGLVGAAAFALIAYFG